MISFIYSLEIINVAVCQAKSEGGPDPNIFLWRAASVSDAAAVNSNSIKTLLANGLSTFPIKGNLVFSNSRKSLPKNRQYCPIFCKWVFDNVTLAEELFAKALPSFETLAVPCEKPSFSLL